ncbi:MAG: 16S rRNA (cytidine(1402)-2'-O)-methyltransferase [Oscillospiraceae bacterium]
MAGKLFVVGTPIGNLSDFSPRALETLKECDFIAAEDTRVTLKLLNRFEIKKPMVSYYEHNRRERGEEILKRIFDGENCALVTDAGMPAISDPGEDLVKLCHESGIKTVAVPGPTAFATAVAMSGMPSGRFTFEGFLSVNKQSRKEHLESVKNEQRTMVFYEAPHKLLATLKDMYVCFGSRKLAIIKEITKIYENVEITTLKEAVEKYENVNPKGEFVLVIEGAEKPIIEEITLDMAIKMAMDLKDSGVSINQSAKEIAKETGIKKSDIYKALMDN